MRRKALLVLTLLAVLAGSAVWSLRDMAARRHAAQDASAALAECRALASRIRRIRSRPAVAADAEALGGEVQTAMEAAARAAGIEPTKLTRITPEPAHRLGDSAYKEKPTHVRLTEVTPRQLVVFVHTLCSGPRAPQPRSLTMRAPRRDGAPGTWSAEIVVTYLVYDPPTSSG